MSVSAFEGPAGTGKTHNLMEQLGSELMTRGLAEHERVLALTFMHGSRRRIDDRLRDIEPLGGRYYATTLDSFAWRLCQRWQALATHLGYGVPGEEQYDKTCSVAAVLLTRETVKSWVRQSYPLVIVDEAQDLSEERSRMISEISQTCHVLIAYDEFQCLNPGLDKLPIESWLPGVCTPTKLTTCRRTDQSELLEAARAVREAKPIQDGRGHFKVFVTPSKPLGAEFLANFIGWRGGGNVAVLTPSRKGGFAEGVVDRVRSGASNKGKGPFPIVWEGSEEREREALWEELTMPAELSVADALAYLEGHKHNPAVKVAREWIARQKRIRGIDKVTDQDIKSQIKRASRTCRSTVGCKGHKFSAMTIQQAKNREFDHVAIIWPYTVPSNDDQRRRLLYNAITRAKRSCIVLVQGGKLKNTAPFT